MLNFGRCSLEPSPFHRALIANGIHQWLGESTHEILSLPIVLDPRFPGNARPAQSVDDLILEGVEILIMVLKIPCEPHRSIEFLKFLKKFPSYRASKDGPRASCLALRIGILTPIQFQKKLSHTFQTRENLPKLSM